MHDNSFLLLSWISGRDTHIPLGGNKTVKRHQTQLVLAWFGGKFPLGVCGCVCVCVCVFQVQGSWKIHLIIQMSHHSLHLQHGNSKLELV